MEPEQRPQYLSLVSGLEDLPYQEHARDRLQALENAVLHSDLPGIRARLKLTLHRANFHMTVGLWSPRTRSSSYRNNVCSAMGLVGVPNPA